MGNSHPSASAVTTARTRGVGFGIAGMTESLLAGINDSIHLFVQIETPEAVQNLAAICDVPGLSGIFVGPGDLSMNYGWVGQLNHPELIEIVTNVIRTARQAGKLVGIMVAPGALLTGRDRSGSPTRHRRRRHRRCFIGMAEAADQRNRMTHDGGRWHTSPKKRHRLSRRAGQAVLRIAKS